jgi:hypothetical protein
MCKNQQNQDHKTQTHKKMAGAAVLLLTQTAALHILLQA